MVVIVADGVEVMVANGVVVIVEAKAMVVQGVGSTVVVHKRQHVLTSHFAVQPQEDGQLMPWGMVFKMVLTGH